MGTVFQGIVFSSLILGISCVDYHKHAADYYIGISPMYPFMRYGSAWRTEELHYTKLTRNGADGLDFKVIHPNLHITTEFAIETQTCVVSSIEFQFKPSETLLTITFSPVNPSWKSLVVKTKMFTWPESAPALTTVLKLPKIINMKNVAAGWLSTTTVTTITQHISFVFVDLMPQCEKSMLPEVVFSLLITGLSCTDYHERAAEYYTSIPQYYPLLRYGSSFNLKKLQRARITRHEYNGLLFEVHRTGNSALFKIGFETFVVSSFKFEFGSSETNLTIDFHTATPSFKSLVAKTKLFTWPKTDELEEHACRHAANIIGPFEYSEKRTSADEIDRFKNMCNSKEKRVHLSLAWVEDLLEAGKPIFSDENRDPGTKIYSCKPILVDEDVLDKLLELRDSMLTKGCKIQYQELSTLFSKSL